MKLEWNVFIRWRMAQNKSNATAYLSFFLFQSFLFPCFCFFDKLQKERVTKSLTDQINKISCPKETIKPCGRNVWFRNPCEVLWCYHSMKWLFGRTIGLSRSNICFMNALLHELEPYIAFFFWKTVSLVIGSFPEKPSLQVNLPKHQLTWLKDILMLPGSRVWLLSSLLTRSLKSLNPVLTSTVKSRSCQTKLMHS